MPTGRSLPVLLLVFVVLLVGCGGGEAGGSQDEGGGNGQQGGGGQANGEAPETKVALGTVVRVNPDNERRITVRPRAQGQEQQGDPMVFKIRRNANVTLDGQPAEVGAVSEGQQAQIEYVTKNDENRAISVRLFKTAGQPAGGEDTSN